MTDPRKPAREHLVAAALIILAWALLALPNLQMRSFIWEEGTNAEIARDVLTHGRFIEPLIYGTRWAEKPSLLPWLIAAVAALTGQVDEWSSRLPPMIAVLGTTLLVHALARRAASRAAALFAAAAFLLSPLNPAKVDHRGARHHRHGAFVRCFRAVVERRRGRPGPAWTMARMRSAARHPGDGEGPAADRVLRRGRRLLADRPAPLERACGSGALSGAAGRRHGGVGDGSLSPGRRDDVAGIHAAPRAGPGCWTISPKGCTWSQTLCSR